MGTVSRHQRPDNFHRPLEKQVSAQSCESDDEEGSAGGLYAMMMGMNLGMNGQGGASLSSSSSKIGLALVLSDKARQLRDAN